MSEPNRGPPGPVNKALGRWEDDGGSPQPSPQSADPALPASDSDLLRVLGAAVLVLWNDLPTQIQRDLFESAAATDDPALQRALTQRLGRHLHQQTGE